MSDTHVVLGNGFIRNVEITMSGIGYKADPVDQLMQEASASKSSVYDFLHHPLIEDTVAVSVLLPLSSDHPVDSRDVALSETLVANWFPYMGFTDWTDIAVVDIVHRDRLISQRGTLEHLALTLFERLGI
jgi:hypothetical protein